MKRKILIKMRVIVSEFSTLSISEAVAVSVVSNLQMSPGGGSLKLSDTRSSRGGDSSASKLQSTSGTFERRGSSAYNPQTSPSDFVLKLYHIRISPEDGKRGSSSESNLRAVQYVTQKEYEEYVHKLKHESKSVVKTLVAADAMDISKPEVLAALASNKNLDDKERFSAIIPFLRRRMKESPENYDPLQKDIFDKLMDSAIGLVDKGQIADKCKDPIASLEKMKEFARRERRKMAIRSELKLSLHRMYEGDSIHFFRLMASMTPDDYEHLPKRISESETFQNLFPFSEKPRAPLNPLQESEEAKEVVKSIYQGILQETDFINDMMKAEEKLCLDILEILGRDYGKRGLELVRKFIDHLSDAKHSTKLSDLMKNARWWTMRALALDPKAINIPALKALCDKQRIEKPDRNFWMERAFFLLCLNFIRRENDLPPQFLSDLMENCAPKLKLYVEAHYDDKSNLQSLPNIAASQQERDSLGSNGSSQEEVTSAPKMIIENNVIQNFLKLIAEFLPRDNDLAVNTADEGYIEALPFSKQAGERCLGGSGRKEIKVGLNSFSGLILYKPQINHATASLMTNDFFFLRM